MKKSSLKRMLHPAFLCLLLLALVKAYSVPPLEVIQRSEEKLLFEDAWKEESGADYQEYSCILPEDMDSDIALAVRGYHARLRVFLDGEEIYTFEDSHYENGNSWCFLTLPDGSGGSKLLMQIAVYGNKYEQKLYNNIYLGEQNAVFLKIIKENAFALVVGSIINLTGIIILLGTILVRKRVAQPVFEGLLSLSIFVILAGIWILTDSRILQLVSRRGAVITVVSFLAFMLMPYFLLQVVKKLMVHRKKGIILLERMHLFNISICIVLYVLQVLPLYLTLVGVHILVLFSIGVVLRDAVLEVLNFRNKEMKKIAVGLVGLVISGLTALIFFYNNPFSRYSVFYGIGLLFFISCVLSAAVGRLKYYFITSARAEEYHEIAHLDSMTHMGNRMAFIKQQDNQNWQENKSCVVFDINNLKAVNDIYGHQEGDRLILDAAECIDEAFGKSGKCYRIGGDEFVAILPVTDEKDILEDIAKMQEYAAQKNKKREVPVEIAYGYAIRQQFTTSFAELFNEADARMYLKKQEMKEGR